MSIFVLFLIFVWFIGALLVTEEGTVMMKDENGKITPSEFGIIFIFSLFSWLTLLGMYVGKKLRNRNENGK